MAESAAEAVRAPFSYDLIAAIYDDDMGRNVGGEDVAFYLARCADAAGPVLELGCGTGRISLPLVAAGRTVTALDVSEPMLERLRAKAAASLGAQERARLDVRAGDMAAFALGVRFARVLCPYSAFTYLVDDARRASALACIRRHLAPGGVFLLDVFVPDPLVEAAGGTPIHDYRRGLADGGVLERSKTIRRESGNVNVITRYYVVYDRAGSVRERITTVDRIRVYQPDELAAVLTSYGFVVQLLPDFAAGPLRSTSKMAAFACNLPETPSVG